MKTNPPEAQPLPPDEDLKIVLDCWPRLNPAIRHKLRLVAMHQQGPAFNADWPGNGPPDTDNRPAVVSARQL